MDEETQNQKEQTAKRDPPVVTHKDLPCMVIVRNEKIGYIPHLDECLAQANIC